VTSAFAGKPAAHNLSNHDRGRDASRVDIVDYDDPVALGGLRPIHQRIGDDNDISQVVDLVDVGLDWLVLPEVQPMPPAGCGV